MPNDWYADFTKAEIERVSREMAEDAKKRGDEATEDARKKAAEDALHAAQIASRR